MRQLPIFFNNRKCFLFAHSRRPFAIIDTEIGQILIMHGYPDGAISMREKTLLLALAQVDYVLCCYPMQVLGVWPEISEKVMYPTHDNLITPVFVCSDYYAHEIKLPMD